MKTLMNGLLLAALLGASVPVTASAAETDIREFVQLAEFSSAKISPEGGFIAVTAPSGNQTGLAVLDIREFPKIEVQAAFRGGPYEHVSEFHWVNERYVAYTTVEQKAALNNPVLTGYLYALDVEAKSTEMHYGLDGGGVFRWFEFVDLLPEEPDWILIETYTSDRTYPKSLKVNVANGRTDRGIGSPLDNGRLFADSNGNIRLASGVDDEAYLQMAWRPDAEADWEPLETGFVPGSSEVAVLGFIEGSDAFALRIEGENRSGIYGFNPGTGKLETLMESDSVTPSRVIEALGSPSLTSSKSIVGAVFADGRTENRFISADEITAKVHGLLARSFPDAHATVTSSTRDGRKSLVAVSSDRRPTEFLLFDIDAMSIVPLVKSREWIEPGAMGTRKPVSYEASDGTRIPAYLTLPAGKEAEDLPLVLLPHGGPHGIRDYWEWDLDAQLLANRGYAVLQPNFRGSGGYGLEFEESGYGQWGTRMQDDMADGVKWVIDQGIADPERICVYGVSFGAYSAVQQMVRFPELYQCAFAFAGIYDLEYLINDEASNRNSSRLIEASIIRRYLGDDVEALRAQSPVNHADKIKGTVFLAHGTADTIAPLEHMDRMEAALEKAGVAYESETWMGEGHGFFDLDNREELYTRLANFIDEHIGD